MKNRRNINQIGFFRTPLTGRICFAGEEGAGAAAATEIKKDPPVAAEPPKPAELSPEQKQTIDTRKAELMGTAAERLKNIRGTGEINLDDTPAPKENYEEKYQKITSNSVLAKLIEADEAGIDLTKLFTSIPAAKPIDVTKIDPKTLYMQSLEGKNYSQDELDFFAEKFEKKTRDEQLRIVEPLREELKKSTSAQPLELLSLVEKATKEVAPIRQKETETYNGYVRTIENTVKELKGDDGKPLAPEKQKALLETAKLLSVVNTPKKRDGTLLGVSPKDIQQVISNAEKIVFYEERQLAAYALGMSDALDPRIRANDGKPDGAPKSAEAGKKKDEHIYPPGFGDLDAGKKFGPKDK